MNLREFLQYVQKNIDQLRKFKDPDESTVLLIRNEMANMGVEATPDQVRSYLKFIGTAVDKMDGKDKTDNKN